MSDNELLAAALEYAARGWAVLPLRPREKVPLTANGSRDATTDAEVLRSWWARWPDANVGIATGGPSGPWVLDLDGPDAMPPGMDLPPTAASTTGRGVHYLFEADERVRNRQRLWGRPADVRGAGGYIVAPPSVHPSGVVYEWRGAAPGALATAPAWLLEAVLRPAQPDAPTQAPERPQAPPTPTGGGEDAALARWLRAAVGAACRRIAEAGEGGRHPAILREATALGGHDARLAAAGLREWARGELQAAGEAAGKPRAEVERAVRDAWAHGAAAPLPEPELRTRVEAPARPVEAPRRQAPVSGPPPLPERPQGPATGTGRARPEVVVTGRDMAEVVADVRRAIRAGGRLFLRGGVLVTVQGAAIVAVGAAELTAEVLRACHLIKTRPPRKGEAGPGDENGGPGLIREPADRLPAYLIPALSGAGDAWLPELDRVVAAPYWLAGELREAPGYHADTRVWLAPGACPRGLPCASAADGVALIRQWLAGFPFAGESDLAHIFAALLTPMLRSEIEGPVPMVVIEAPVAGTGKSLLAEVCAWVAGGVPAVAAPLATHDEERRKALVTLFAQGSPVIWLDNVDRRLDDPVLALAVTTGRVQDRALGTQRVMTLSTHAQVLVTANNLELTRDLERRSVRVRLDSGLDRPELRGGFAIGDLRRWTRERLPALREALYGMVAAWVQAGQPLGRERRGSFERWSEVVGGVLQVAGLPGFLAAPVRVGGDLDPIDMEWAALLVMMGDGAHTAAELVMLADGEGLLGDVTGDGPTQARATRLSRALRRHRDRVWTVQDGRRRLVSTMRPGSKVWAWAALDPDAPERAGQVLAWTGPRPGDHDAF